MSKRPPSWEVLPPDYITVIGQLALGASELDVVLTDHAAALLEVDIFRAIAVFHHQQAASKVSTLKALAHVLFRDHEGKALPEIEKITSLFDRAKVEMEYRNGLIHAYWMVDADGKPHAVRFSARGKVERNRRPVEIAEIRSHVAAIRELLDDLRQLRALFRSSLPKGPGAKLPP